MPDVGRFDNEADWMAACIPARIGEGDEQDQAVAACRSMWREKETGAKATTRTVDGVAHPASHFLVVEDPEAPSTWHLQVRDADGRPDHRLMGAAWAALHGGFRGNVYEGPGKREALVKLRALYEAEEMPTPGDTKEGRRLRHDKLQWLKDLRSQLSKWLDDLRGVEAWADYTDGPPVELKEGLTFQMFKARDGRTWLLTWTTNAFVDRDGELFTTKAIEDYVTRHEGDDIKGGYQLWHLPGTKFGTIRWQGVVGRFLVEAGPFDDTPVGERFKAFFEAHPDGHPEHAPRGWATSHGYSYLEGDRADGVYDWFDKRETSVLPFEAAANQHNPKPEVLSMNDKQRALLRDIGGEELVAAVITTGESQTKALEEQGVAFKAAGPGDRLRKAAEGVEDEGWRKQLLALADEAGDDKAALAKGLRAAAGKAEGYVKKLCGDLADELDPPEKAADEKDAPAVDAKALAAGIAAELHLSELSDTIEVLTEAARAHDGGLKALTAELAGAIKAVSDEVAGLKAQVAELQKADETRIAEKMTAGPRFSWFRASQAAATVLNDSDPNDAALKAKQPTTPAAIQAIARRMSGEQ